jgi:hypothetical protein
MGMQGFAANGFEIPVAGQPASRRLNPFRQAFI